MLSLSDLVIAKAILGGNTGEADVPEWDEEVIIEGDAGGGGDTPSEDIGVEKYFEAVYEDVVLPNAKSIRDYCFSNNTAMKSITAPNVTKIGQRAFYGETPMKLETINMPNLTEIGVYAFRRCTNLALTSLPSGITKIGQAAFMNCTNLALTSLPSGLTTLEREAFEFCENITITSLPSSITQVGYVALGYCTGITSLTFTKRCNVIDSSAFKGCTNLLTINVPWSEGSVANAPWGATNATINYNYTGE